jgi:GAF domain-containing protein/HAMP domain-containing protein
MDSEKAEIDQSPRSVKTGRLQTRLALGFALLAILSTGIVTIVLYWNVRNQLLQDVRVRVRDAVSIASLQVDGDAHATLVDASQEGNETYNQIKHILQLIRDAGTQFVYVYTLRITDGRVFFVVDAETDPDEISHLMDEYYEFDPAKAAILAELKEPLVDEEFYTDRWGTWLTGYAPIFTSDGNLEAILSMDVDASQVRTEINQLLWVTLFAFGAMIAIVGLIGWLLGRALAEPIVRLTEGAKRITAGDLTYQVSVAARDETYQLAQAYNIMTARLREMISSLESRVAERTGEVEALANYLRAASEVGRAAGSILDTQQLIRQVVDVIRERFNLYYVGLFLLDATGEYAVLQAGTGEAGRIMLERGHRIKVGEGMIGWSIANKKPRVALEAGEDAVRLASSLLPLTRSEAALPLISRGKVLGALSVQSERPGIFTEETITVLQTMADQVALALDNARLFAESEEALKTLQRSYGELSHEAWAELIQSRRILGYRWDGQGIHPVTERDKYQAFGEDTNLVRVPIRIREQIVGVIEARKPETSGVWTQEEYGFLNTLVDQLSLALENARLYEDTQGRAERERVLADITAKVRSTTDVSAILRTAIQELAGALRVPQGSIRLRPTEPTGVADRGVKHGD